MVKYYLHFLVELIHQWQQVFFQELSESSLHAYS